MKPIALLLAVGFCSCAQIEGRGYKATFVMTDFKAYQQSADQITMTGVKQSTVPVQVLRTGERVAAGVLAADVANTLSGNSTAEVLGQQATVRHAAEQTTARQALKVIPPPVP
jgi:hypothetical protein